MKIEFGQVTLTLRNGGRHSARARRIAELTCEYVSARMAQERWRHNTTLAQLEVPPLTVQLDTMSDEAVACATAEAIYQAWLRSAPEKM